MPKSMLSSPSRSYSIRGIIAVARSRVLVDCRPQNPSIATPRSARCAGVMLSASGPRRCDCKKPLAPRSPVTFRILSAKTGPYSTQCPSPSMTGCVRLLRISSGVWCALMWLLPTAEDAISRKRILAAQPKSKGGDASRRRGTTPHPEGARRFRRQPHGQAHREHEEREEHQREEGHQQRRRECRRVLGETQDDAAPR